MEFEELKEKFIKFKTGYFNLEKDLDIEDQNDPLVMYLIVKESLNMSAGKIAAQVGHAVGMLGTVYLLGSTYDIGEPILEIDRDMIHNYVRWELGLFRKVVLKAKDKDWERLKDELACVVVRDAGLTEVEPGSETVIGVMPMRKSQAPKILKRLQVLK